LTKSSPGQYATLSQISSTKLQENKDLIRFLDAVRSVIFYFDRWGAVIYGNRRACLWRPLEETKGKTFIEIAQHWDDPVEIQREIMQVIRCGVPIWGSQERAVELGIEYWYKVDIIPTTDDDTEVDGVMLVITDVSDSVSSELALRESEARYQAFIANSADAIWCFDVTPPVSVKLAPQEQIKQLLRRATLVECNHTLAQLFGVSDPAQVLGMPLHRSRSFSSKGDVKAFIENGYRLDSQELKRIDEHGQCRYMQSSAIGVVEHGRLVRAWGITRDITAQKTYIDHMEYLATHDSLTRLPNRTLLYKTMAYHLEHAPRDRLMALMLIDLDRFKEINDTLGHRAGDTLLQQLGPRLEAEMSETEGIVARLGGDEFAVFLPRIRNWQQAIVLGHRFVDCLSEPFQIENIRTATSASVGISYCPHQAHDVSTLMRYSDVAMYHAKTTHKGVSVYNPEEDPHSPSRLELVGDLKRAIADDELRLYFQPKIAMQSHQVSGFEALVRWPHPTQGMIPPTDFVAIAEKASMIFSLTCWVMDKAIQQCASWREQGFDISMSINLSPRNLTDERLLPELKRLLYTYHLPGEFIELEITESVIVADPERATQAIERIAELGVCFSIDDYGTGFSSLANLKKLPVDTLKIDKSFVLNMLDDEQDEIIVSSTIMLAHNLGIKVVAEGVETQELYQKLISSGCDFAQGFYPARPMNVDVAARWLESSEWSARKTA